MLPQLLQDIAERLFYCAIGTFFLLLIGLGSVEYYIASAKSKSSEDAIIRALSEFGKLPLGRIYGFTDKNNADFVVSASFLGGMIWRVCSSVVVMMVVHRFWLALVEDSATLEQIILNGFVIVFSLVGILFAWCFGHSIRGLAESFND